MAKNIVFDNHYIEPYFLWQYKTSGKFKKYVESFIQPAFLNLETQFLAMESLRTVDQATGDNLKLWADRLGIPYTGQSDEALRDEIYWASAEMFSTGSIYEAKAFFENYYRAKNVEIKELGGGKLELNIIDGHPKTGTTPTDWPCFPPGLAEVTNITFTDGGSVFVFQGDTNPLGSGYGIVDRSRNPPPDSSPSPYVFPTDPSITGNVISISVTSVGEIINVELVFKYVAPNDLKNIFTTYFTNAAPDETSGGFISFKDRNGTEWEFFPNQALIADPLFMTVSGNELRIRCVKDNAVWVKVRVNGVSIPWIWAYGVPGWFPAFSAWQAGEGSLFLSQNPYGLTVTYQITERPGIGGRLTLKGP